MPCESCTVQFSVFKRKRICTECDRYYCTSCLRRGGGNMCASCRLLSSKPLSTATIAHLKVRDLQCFLHRQNVSTRGCVEKEELLRLCVVHVNSAGYRRRGGGWGTGFPGAGGRGAFTLRGFTNNINDLITSALEMRTHNSSNSAHPSNCYNQQHVHSPTAPQPPHSPLLPERFTATPGGETRIEVPVPEASSPSASSPDALVAETADCFEVEDLDDSSWELLNASSEPLPNDSDVLISMTAASPRRASSDLHLSPAAPDAAGARDPADSTSLSEEPIASVQPEVSSASPKPAAAAASAPAPDGRVQLSSLQSEAQLEALSARQLKELLARNRVEYRGCVERDELLERARTLLRDHLKYRDVVEQLPESEVCKICMCAPVECVLLECGHLAACTACAARLPACPLCRRYVVRAVRVFRA